MSTKTPKTEKIASATIAGKAALEALAKALPQGVTVEAGLTSLFADKETRATLKEAGALAGVKVTQSTDGMTAEQKKTEVLAYAESIGMKDHPMVGKLKQVTRVTKGSSEVIYVLIEVGGTACSNSVKRTVPHKENGGAASEKLTAVCDIVKKQVFLSALRQAEDAIAVNDAIAAAAK